MTEKRLIHSLRLDHIKFAYEGQRPLFEELSCDLPLGDNVFVTGADGSGQSTLLKIIAVLALPQAGAFYINPCAVQAVPPQSALLLGLKAQPLELLPRLPSWVKRSALLILGQLEAFGDQS